MPDTARVPLSPSPGQGDPWPDWLDGLTAEHRVHAVVHAVANRYSAEVCDHGNDGEVHVQAADAAQFLLRLLREARAESAAAPDGVAPIPSAAGPKVTLGILRSQVSAAIEACCAAEDTSSLADAVMAVVSPVVEQVWASRRVEAVAPGD